MSFRRLRLPAYVIDAGTMCRGIRAFCRSGSISIGKADPAAALLDIWLGEDAPAFAWVYSEHTLVVYEAVLCRLELSSRFVDRVTGTIRHLGLKTAPPLGVEDSPQTIEDAFRAAAASVDEAAVVTPDPARFPDAGRIRVLSPAEALADLSDRARYTERTAGLASFERPGGPAVQGWSA